HGPMSWIASDAYIGKSLELYGEYSASETTLFQHFVQPASTVLDVGANIGVFTIALARLVTPTGAVLAFEPQQAVFDVLSTNVEANFLTNVTLHQVGVGRDLGTLNVPALDYDVPGNFGGVELSGITDKGTPVDVITIDSLDLAACNFIKIDVEGMESEVIAGAADTIRKLRPVIFIENDRKQKSAEIIEALFDLNYRIYLHLASLYNATNFFKNTENVFGPIVSANMLCLPSEFDQNIKGMTEVQTADDMLSVLR
ncbi:MAG: FkbM family methyltransferase, partial [Rhodospirillales bacterium]|nr:FkbM family methyltransferase [Rhodospirillales bacterium]